MTTSYCEGTGTLVLEKVTPIIEALFSGLSLDKSYPGHGEAYITDINSEDRGWDSIRESLAEVSEAMKILPTSEVQDEHDGRLHALFVHFGDKSGELFKEVAGYEGSESASISELYRIAQVLNDGHGLKAIKFESAYHCSKPRLFEFGGSGLYLSNECTLDSSSNAALMLGVDLRNALEANDLNRAAQLVCAQTKLILNGIHDAKKSEGVAKELIALLAV